jgi:hypothetical protein
MTASAWLMAAMGLLNAGAAIAYAAEGRWLHAGVWTAYAAGQVFWMLIARNA